jgi:hypothetical protein
MSPKPGDILNYSKHSLNQLVRIAKESQNGDARHLWLFHLEEFRGSIFGVFSGTKSNLIGD